METLEELFHETLRDIYYAEKKILKALPKMAKRASSRDLAAAYEAHLQETEDQVERLEKVFEMLGKNARGKTCPAIDGIVEEADEILKEAKSDTVRDAGSLAAAGCRALRNFALWHSHRLGRKTRNARCGRSPRPDAARGKGDRREADRPRRVGN